MLWGKILLQLVIHVDVNKMTPSQAFSQTTICCDCWGIFLPPTTKTQEWFEHLWDVLKSLPLLLT